MHDANSLGLFGPPDIPGAPGTVGIPGDCGFEGMPGVSGPPMGPQGPPEKHGEKDTEGMGRTTGETAKPDQRGIRSEPGPVDPAGRCEFCDSYAQSWHTIKVR
ncbi:collagen alpha-1(XII) chain-like isoform X2 [Atheta coriaria]|uniref:collagen alpha-1(XII) chain-like isoform X2 n=1 Tax=Dalotia coriaria TaxID=877792 RepID=UPI0031F35E25